ncbi:hypothetical protein RQP46_009229 [Phenoliferia psychrophenolica]
MMQSDPADPADAAPVVFIKKRSKGGVRPSASSSSLRQPDSPAAASPLAAQPDDEDDEGNVAVIRRKKTPAGRVKDREGGAGGSPKPKSRLSFGGGAEDEEEETFVKRTDSPRRLLNSISSSSSSTRADVPASLDQASISAPPTPVKSIYSKEYLNQLKATSTPPPPSRGGEFDELTRSKFARVIDDVPSEIPTTAAINSAREKRERMRLDGGGSGSDAFISLEVGMANKSGQSRLMREEDEIGDGDDDLAEFTGAQETVPLGKKANKEAAERMRSGMVDMIQDAQEDADDDEAQEWELAQIKRGEQRRTGASKSSPAKRAYRAAPIPSSSTLPSLAGVSARLSTALSTLQASHTIDSAALEHFARERAELDAQELELRGEVERMELKNRWFGDFKTFIEEVAAFLDEKHVLLEKIEQSNLAIQKERYEIVSRRRYADDADDVALFTGLPVPPTFSLLPGSPSLDPPSPDLFPRSSLRTFRRSDRLSRPGASDADDTLASPDAADLAAALASLRADLAALFADVKADDFRDPNLGIRTKFEEWRDKFRDEYENAYGGLALVGVWEFWARVEMALWNPFEIAQLGKTPAGLDAYSWHTNLSAFGHTVDDDASESETVVNALVTSVVIPLLEKLARASFDPLSVTQTTRALGLIDEVSYCVEKSSPRFESLIQSFLSRLQLAVTQSQGLVAPHLASIALPQNAFDPSTFDARNRFLARQVALVKNALRWRRWARNFRLPVAGEGAGAGGSIDDLVVRELVAKVVLPVAEAGWATGGQEAARSVLEILPQDAVPPALRRRLEGQQGA